VSVLSPAAVMRRLRSASLVDSASQLRVGVQLLRPALIVRDTVSTQMPCRLPGGRTHLSSDSL
jgi:hypothetical protein